MNFFSTFSDFWEILTGVVDDNRAKIIRFLCFFILFAGIGWAVFNYFRADILADTDSDAAPQEHYVPEDDGRALKRMATLARTVQDMKHGGMSIAEQINVAHTRPFNVNVSTDVAEVKAALSSDAQAQAAEDKSPEIFVRAIMKEGKKLTAVVDAGENFKGHIVRRGTVLPNELGRVMNITSNKVIVRRDRKNYEYGVMKLETDLERKLQGKNPNSGGSSNSSRPGQAQMGVEQFLFEGTVPDDSPLTTSVKEEELKK